jgi:hypothetical protein
VGNEGTIFYFDTELNTTWIQGLARLARLMIEQKVNPAVTLVLNKVNGKLKESLGNILDRNMRGLPLEVAAVRERFGACQLVPLPLIPGQLPEGVVDEKTENKFYGDFLRNPDYAAGIRTLVSIACPDPEPEVDGGGDRYRRHAIPAGGAAFVRLCTLRLDHALQHARVPQPSSFELLADAELKSSHEAGMAAFEHECRKLLPLEEKKILYRSDEDIRSVYVDHVLPATLLNHYDATPFMTVWKILAPARSVKAREDLMNCLGARFAEMLRALAGQRDLLCVADLKHVGDTAFREYKHDVSLLLPAADDDAAAAKMEDEKKVRLQHIFALCAQMTFGFEALGDYNIATHNCNDFVRQLVGTVQTTGPRADVLPFVPQSHSSTPWNQLKNLAADLKVLYSIGNGRVCDFSSTFKTSTSATGSSSSSSSSSSGLRRRRPPPRADGAALAFPREREECISNDDDDRRRKL